MIFGGLWPAYFCTGSEGIGFIVDAYIDFDAVASGFVVLLLEPCALSLTATFVLPNSLIMLNEEVNIPAYESFVLQ